MATLSAACLLAAAGAWWDLHRAALLAALALVCVGSLITIWRRTRRIVRDLEARAAAPAPPEASEARDAPEAADAHDAPGGTR